MLGNDVIQVVGRGSNVDFTIDDSVPFAKVIKSLQAYLKENRTLYSRGSVSVNVGRRLASADEMAQIKQTLEQGWGFNVTRYWCAPDVLDAVASGGEGSSGQLEHLARATASPSRPDQRRGITDGWEGPESAKFIEAAYLAQLKAEEESGKEVQPKGPAPKRSRSSAVVTPAKTAATPRRELRRSPAENRPTDALLVKATCRSGEEIRHHGDVIILGDVNPGAEIIAGGDIVVMGSLRGLAHAGCEGNHDAAIIAMNLDAPRLQIGLCSGAATHSTRESKSTGTVPKIAYVRERSIYVDRYVGRFAGYSGGTLYGG
jgi:septum site-determining protein MinC